MKQACFWDTSVRPSRGWLVCSGLCMDTVTFQTLQNLPSFPLHNRSGHPHVRRLTQRPLCDCVRATCSHPTTTFGSKRSRTMTCSSAAEATIRRGDTSDDHCNCMTRLPLQYCWICITVMTEMTALSVLSLGSAADHFPDPLDCPHDRRASDAFVLCSRCDSRCV